MVQKSDARRSSHSIQCMARQFTAQLQGSLSKDNKPQSLHESGTILSDGVFKQAPQTDAKHFCTCKSSLRVQSWSKKPMNGQYRRLTEQPPVDMKETYRWLKSSNLPAATEGLVVAAQDQALPTRYYECNILHRDVSPTCHLCSVGLEQLTTLSQAVVPWHRWTTLIDTIRWSPLSIGTFVVIWVPVENRWYQHHPERLVETYNITMM